MSDRRKCINNTYAGKKTKVWKKPTKPFLTKVRITTKGNGSMNMNVEKGSIAMNITMMTLI